MFERAEEIFDEVAGLVKLAIVLSGCSALAPGRNDGLDSGLFQRLNDPVVSVLSAITAPALRSVNRTSDPTRSCAWPGVSKNRVGLPRASVKAWIDNPPRDRPVGSDRGHRRCADERERRYCRSGRIPCRPPGSAQTTAWPRCLFPPTG